MHPIDLILKENWRHDNDDLLSKILEESRIVIPLDLHPQLNLIILTN